MTWLYAQDPGNHVCPTCSKLSPTKFYATAEPIPSHDFWGILRLPTTLSSFQEEGMSGTTSVDHINQDASTI